MDPVLHQQAASHSHPRISQCLRRRNAQRPGPADAADDSVLTLDPTFDAATLEYGATVGRDVDEVTIIPTLNDTGASYEIQDDEGTALTDVDTTQDDFQVSISPGPNTINVVITG